MGDWRCSHRKEGDRREWMGGWRSREAVRLSRCGFGKRRRGWDVVLTENAISQIVAVSRQERAPATGPARSTKTSTSTHLEKTFTPAPSQWAGENGSTGPIEIQGPRRQDMAALGSVRRWTPDAVSGQARDNAWRYSSWCRLSPTLVPFGVPLLIVTAHSQGQECARHWARDIDRIQDINFTWSVFQRGSSTSIYHSVAIIPFSCPSRAHSKSLHSPTQRMRRRHSPSRQLGHLFTGSELESPCRNTTGCTTGLPNTTTIYLAW